MYGFTGEDLWLKPDKQLTPTRRNIDLSLFMLYIFVPAIFFIVVQDNIRANILIHDEFELILVLLLIYLGLSPIALFALIPLTYWGFCDLFPPNTVVFSKKAIYFSDKSENHRLTISPVKLQRIEFQMYRSRWSLYRTDNIKMIISPFNDSDVTVKLDRYTSPYALRQLQDEIKGYCRRFWPNVELIDDTQTGEVIVSDKKLPA